MQLNVTTRASGQQQFRSRIKALQRASDKELHKIGKLEVIEVQDRIRTGKMSPDGRSWAPWSLATRRQRQREGGGNGLLYRTGKLFRSIKYRVSAKTLTVYSDAPYAKYLQNGTMRMPARQFLGWSTQQINKIKAIMIGAISK